ncbi:MAG: HEPN domain-containing protein [Thermodesulfobacteriota bacterium]
MPHERHIPGSAADWLARAKGDLAIAKAPIPAEAFYEDLCFHTQQAAEKALKAVYQHKGWTFRYTHDLDELITGLKKKGLYVPSEVIEADVLTAFGWDARYPGPGEPVTQEEYIEALQRAESVIAWAEKIMGLSGHL